MNKDLIVAQGLFNNTAFYPRSHLLEHTHLLQLTGDHSAVLSTRDTNIRSFIARKHEALNQIKKHQLLPPTSI